MRTVMRSVHRITAGVAAFFWLITGVAVVSHIGGNPTAINGVLGAGFWALGFTGWTVVEWCDHKRYLRRRTPTHRLRVLTMEPTFADVIVGIAVGVPLGIGVGILLRILDRTIGRFL